MCGRFTQTYPKSALRGLFDFETDIVDLAPRYNLAPSQEAAVVVFDGVRRLKFMRWGLIPSWAKDKALGVRLINARAETAAEKPAFRSAFRKCRCLVLADGFYEWRKNEGGGKTPMHIRFMDGRPFAMAGLWEEWRDPDGQPLQTFTILTTTANDLIAGFHSRMPVILSWRAADLWLDPAIQDAARLADLLVPHPAGEMEAFPVSPLVNSARNDGPECVRPMSAS